MRHDKQHNISPVFDLLPICFLCLPSIDSISQTSAFSTALTFSDSGQLQFSVLTGQSASPSNAKQTVEWVTEPQHMGHQSH